MNNKRSTCIGIDFASRGGALRSVSVPAATKRIRLSLLFGGAFAWCGLVLLRLFTLQISGSETWQGWAVRQHVAEVKLASERGPILDRNGRLLAVSVPASSIYVRPREIADKQATAEKLAALVDMNVATVVEKLNDKAPFVWLKRQMPRQLAEKVMEEKLSGVGTALESRRFYPYGVAASTLIGKVGIDGNGLSGLEALYEEHLNAEHLSTRVSRDAFGNIIQVSSDGGSFEIPRGMSLELTLDAGLQMIVDEELEAGRLAAKAKGAMAVMIDSHTGQILAMSQAPGVNLNTVSVREKGDLKNRLIETVFEPGSTLKPIVMAAALEAKVTTPQEVFDCESGRFKYSKHIIKDVHPHALLSARDVVIRSSNIGMTKIGDRMGAKRLYAALRQFGFGESGKLGLPGATRGILRPVDGWAMVDVATHSFGQGIAVTPLQMVRAFAAIANGGKLPELGIVSDGKEPRFEKILSERTASLVRDMLYGVVEEQHGTGKLAAVKGIRVGGKTGTAQKARTNGRGYQPGAYVASFIGFAEATELGLDRNLTLIVMIDEPRSGSIYGGTLAAPVFRKIMQRSVHHLATQRELEPEGDVAFPANIRQELTRNPLMKASYNF